MSFTTTYSMTNPAIRVGVADSRIQSLSFTEYEDPAVLQSSVKDALTNALTEHEESFLTTLEQMFMTPDVDRDAVMEVVDEMLSESRDVEPKRRDWFPTQADGRDQTGGVHVSVIGTRVEIFEVPDDLWEEPAEAETAIIEATNLALDRLAEDIAMFTAGRSPDEPMPQLNWSELKQQMDRLEQGYF